MAENTKPLTNNLKWDEYFMGLAKLSAMRSKDPSTQVGACIVDDNHKVVSIGYNGMPRGVCDDEIPWGHGEGLDSKYLYVCHAEFNAILNTRDGSALNGCTIYVTSSRATNARKPSFKSASRKSSLPMINTMTIWKNRLREESWIWLESNTAATKGGMWRSVRSESFRFLPHLHHRVMLRIGRHRDFCAAS